MRLASLGSTIFLSAFCLFQVQPLIARSLLPWFGGAAGVWTVCLLFFQLALLVGYAYAHWTIGRLSPRVQSYLHIALLAASLLALPILPNPAWKYGSGDPLFRIAGLLAATIGLPYILLSSTSPLLQSWYTRTAADRSAYRLFALSNLGSLAGLLTFPFLLEPHFTGTQQAWLWSALYAAFALFCGAEAWRARLNPPLLQSESSEAAAIAPSAWDQTLWVALSAAAAALLLAVSSHITLNVAPMPLIWIVPLALYLLSFILCFDNPRWYRRIIFLPLSALAASAMTWGMFATSNGPYDGDIRWTISLYSAGLFVWCMTLHGEMVRRKPDVRYLTRFYLLVAGGGAVGGLLIAAAAPRLLRGMWDLNILLGLCPALLLAVLWRNLFRNRWPKAARLAVASIACLAVAGLSGYLIFHTYLAEKDNLWSGRNFYGALRVRERESKFGELRLLLHGTIVHGEQFLGPGRERIATTYYWTGSGLGRAIQELQETQPISVGAVGLGVGTVAAYMRPGDRLRVYEINPLVVDYARQHFTFLSTSPIPTEIVMGDGRLSLEREPSQQFDLLTIDAFSGDAVPIHLLTREALDVYWRHLKPDGVLAIHVSNRHLKLEPIAWLGLSSFGRPIRIVIGKPSARDDAFASNWLLSTNRSGFFEHSLFAKAGKIIKPDPSLRMWTDEYSSVLPVLRF